MVAALPAVAAALRAFGVIDLDKRRQDALAEAVRFASALVIADAVVRAGRSVGLGRHLEAGAPQWPEPVIGDDVGESLRAIAFDDETGEPLVDGVPPRVPVAH
jgi:hypothetical protein